ncbi:hypothetical protein L1887_43184 [Cichorium endivia]|nr:hypothetical protein L1887_43184 [Cichorium endivia]
MIGRADIEGSKSNVAMNAWLPQASYPVNQTSFYPSVPHEISVLVELILGHLRYLLTDVPPQPNSPPDNVFRPDRPAEAGLGSKKRGIAPLPIHGIIGFPLSVPVLSWLFDARGRPPKEPFPVRPPAGTRRPALRRGSSSSSPPDSRRVRDWDPPVPSPQSQSFSRGYGSILPTSLAYIVPSTRGCSPWRPDAVMSTTGAWEALGSSGFSRAAGGAPDTARQKITLPEAPADVSGLPNVADRLTHVQVPFTWNLSPLRPSKFSFEIFATTTKIRTDGRSAQAHAQGFAATAAPSYSSGPGTCPDGRVSAQFGTVTRLPVHPASPVLLTKNGPLGALDSVARLNEAAAPSTYLKTRTRGSSYPEGNFGGNQLLDGSISLSAPIPKSDERFARQYRCGPPPEFSSGFAPLRHSSPSFGSRQACSHSNPSQKIKVGRRCTPLGGSRQSASLRLAGLLTR